MEHFDREAVDSALEAWARWAKSALYEIGWPAMNIIARIVKYGVRGAAENAGLRVVEQDEMCELVDRAILRLDETEREVVVQTYMYYDAAPVTARKCGLTYQYYRNVLSRARKRVADFLEGARQSLV